MSFFKVVDIGSETTKAIPLLEIHVRNYYSTINIIGHSCSTRIQFARNTVGIRQIGVSQESPSFVFRGCHATQHNAYVLRKLYLISIAPSYVYLLQYSATLYILK